MCPPGTKLHTHSHYLSTWHLSICGPWQAACIDAPWAFRPVWALLKPLIGKYSSVVQFCKLEVGRCMFTPGEPRVHPGLTALGS